MNFEMNLVWAVILLPAGLVILLKGADLLVDGAVALAERFGVSPLVVGLTVVAMGTSAPEVATSITATIKGFGDIAISNVYGSNIANLALVGGLCAMIRPISVKLSVLRRELPIMLIVALLLWPILANLHLGRAESAALLALFVVLLVFTVLTGLRDAKKFPQDAAQVDAHIHDKGKHPEKSLTVAIILVVVGLAALALGAELSIRAGVYIGAKAGLSKVVIGITIIAVGTSLPELVTCVVAAFKGHDDISIGTLVGSNIFNTMLAVGTAGLIRPFTVSPRLIGVDFWVMIAVSAAFLLIAVINRRISRLSGLVLTTAYAAYMVYVLALTRSI